MFPYRGNGGRGRGCDKCVGMLAGENIRFYEKGLAVGVEASGAGGEPEGVSGDTRPLGVVDMMVGSSKRWGPGQREGSKNNF